MENFVVMRRQRPWYLLLQAVVLVAVLIMGAWFFLASVLGVSTTPGSAGWDERTRQIAELTEQNSALERQVAHMLQEKTLFERQILMLEKASDMDKEALGALHDELKAMQESVFKFKQELEFYQAVLNNPQNSNGLAVQGLYVEAMPRGNRFRYKIVLTRFGKGNKLLKGRLAMKLSGDLDGKEQTLDLKNLAIDDGRDFAFSLRNFTVFEGYLEIPDRFAPAQAMVYLISSDGKRTLAERSFDWQVAT